MNCTTTASSAPCPGSRDERWLEPIALHVFIGRYDRQDEQFPYRAYQSEILALYDDGFFSVDAPTPSTAWWPRRKICGSVPRGQVTSWVDRWARLAPPNGPLRHHTTVVRVMPPSDVSCATCSERRWVPEDEPAPHPAACLLGEMIGFLEEELGRSPLRVFDRQLTAEFARCPSTN